ncbi:MAG: glutathione peroxidase, partial [Bdellovibrionales bacterium]|nr:glutathione peroxidase [Bdellovibrionales bacterium]
MKFLIPFIFIFSTFSLAADIYDFDLKNTKGETIYLKNFKGKSVLIVNIATRCGYTNQLDDLEALYQKYKSKGLVIIAVPSNDFGSQTPEENEEVVKFCKINYGVSFPITTKMSIKGPQQAKLFSFLTQATGG